MSAAARVRRGGRGILTPEVGKIALLVVVIGGFAFLIGFGLTALSFVRGSAPVDVVTVPDVRDLRVPDARRILGRSDLDLAVGDSFPNPMVPAGAILAQSPLPGQEVGPRTEIRVIVSTGQPRPIVPDVDAMPVALATRVLQTAGFQVLVEEAPGEGTLGMVFGTVPEAGTAVPLPATVRIWVGGARPPFEMPSVIGMLEDAARATLEAGGLRVGEIDYETSALGEVGGVVGQDPPPGDSVHVGSAVRLRVTGRAPPTILPEGDG